MHELQASVMETEEGYKDLQIPGLGRRGRPETGRPCDPPAGWVGPKAVLYEVVLGLPFLGKALSGFPSHKTEGGK